MLAVEELCQHTGVELSACVMRGEMQQAITGFRRELSGYAKNAVELRAELNSKLDQILSTKTDEARQMGQLEAQVTRLSADVKDLRDEIKNVRDDLQDDIQNVRTDLQAAKQQPRDGLLRFAADVLKLLIAAGVGYFLARGH